MQTNRNRDVALYNTPTFLMGIMFQVARLVLNEEGNVKKKEGPLLRSLWEQTAPLFKAPFLMWTLALYYLNFVAYASYVGITFTPINLKVFR